MVQVHKSSYARHCNVVGGQAQINKTDLDKLGDGSRQARYSAVVTNIVLWKI